MKKSNKVTEYSVRRGVNKAGRVVRVNRPLSKTLVGEAVDVLVLAATRGKDFDAIRKGILVSDSLIVSGAGQAVAAAGALADIFSFPLSPVDLRNAGLPEFVVKTVVDLTWRGYVPYCVYLDKACKDKLLAVITAHILSVEVGLSFPGTEENLRREARLARFIRSADPVLRKRFRPA